MSEIFLPQGYDFYYLYCGGTLAAQNHNVYDLTQYSYCLHGIGWPDSEGIQGLTHPFWNIPVYYLISLLDFNTAKIIWLVLSILSLLLIANIIKKHVLLFNELVHLRTIIILFATFSFPATIKTLYWGQMTFLPAFFLVLTISLIQKNSLFLGGLALSLTMLKFHLFIPFYIALFIWTLKRKNLSLLGGFFIGFALLLCLSCYIYPTGLVDYIAAISTIHTQSQYILGASIGQIILIATHISILRYLPLTVITIITLFYSVKKQLNLDLIILIGLPLSLIATPYAWSHDGVMLLTPYIFLIDKIQHLVKKALPYVLFAFGILGDLLNANVRLEAYASLIPILICSYWVYYFSTKSAAFNKFFR